ncbi:hypothetical protein PV327_011141, partial [Microctonus hyperodae]
LLVQNAAELKALSIDVKNIQRHLKKKCTYDGGDHDDSVDNSGHQDNLEIKYDAFQVKRMCQIINKSDTANKNMTTIIRAYISRNVTTLYVPRKSPMGNQSKPVFKITRFYECIEAMRKNLKNSLGNDLTDKDILNYMASTIRNARDWEGHRLLRTQNTD